MPLVFWCNICREIINPATDMYFDDAAGFAHAVCRVDRYKIEHSKVKKGLRWSR